jgi:tetratricopeptide (TPR) repeat protein
MNLTRILTALAIAAGTGVAFWVLRPNDRDLPEHDAEALLAGEFSGQRQETASFSRNLDGESAADGAVSPAGQTLAPAEDALEPDENEVPEEDVAARLVTTAIETMLRREPPGSERANGSTKGGRSSRKRGRADGGDKGDTDDPGTGYDPVRSKRLWQEARDAREAGEYDRAVELLNESIEQDPLNKQAYRDLAGVYRTMGMQAEELQTYQDWIDASPNDPLAHYMAASAYERYGMDQEAYARVADFQRLNAGDVSTYPMAASMYSRLGMKDQQGAVLESWVSDVPGSLDARRALGQYYQSQGDHAAALAQYGAAAELVPGNAAAHVDMARAYTGLGEYDAAEGELMVATELRPDDLGIQLQLGKTRQRAGDPYGARDAYQGILDANPNAPEARQASKQINRIDRQLAAGNQNQKATTS